MLSFYLSFLLKYILKPHQMSDHDQYTKTYYNIFFFLMKIIFFWSGTYFVISSGTIYFYQAVCQ